MSENGELTQVLQVFIKKKMVLQRRFAHCSCENAALTFVLRSRSARNARFGGARGGGGGGGGGGGARYSSRSFKMWVGAGEVRIVESNDTKSRILKFACNNFWMISRMKLERGTAKLLFSEIK